MAKSSDSGVSTFLIAAAVIGVVYEVWIWYRTRSAAGAVSASGGSYAGGYSPYNPYGATTAAQLAAAQGQGGGSAVVTTLGRLLMTAIGKMGGNVYFGSTKFAPSTAYNYGNGGETLPQLSSAISAFSTQANMTPLAELGGQSLTSYDPNGFYGSGGASTLAPLPYVPMQTLDMGGTSIPSSPFDMSGLGGLDTSSISPSADIINGGLDMSGGGFQQPLLLDMAGTSMPGN
ncbi:MAG TPA: hypothetical protein VMW51_09750 [Terriglobia bacterium]|nr:hypothetical protein [Terriglobia bacterium]